MHTLAHAYISIFSHPYITLILSYIHYTYTYIHSH